MPTGGHELGVISSYLKSVCPLAVTDLVLSAAI